LNTPEPEKITKDNNAAIRNELEQKTAELKKDTEQLKKGLSELEEEKKKFQHLRDSELQKIETQQKEFNERIVFNQTEENKLTKLKESLLLEQKNSSRRKIQIPNRTKNPSRRKIQIPS